MTDSPPQRATKRGARALVATKLLHTVVWAIFAGAICAIPLFAWSRRFDWVAGLTALVFVEVLILVVNRWRCPLTPLAARFTDDRRDNFDIYLPLWLARHNKAIFGTLFVLGLVFSFVCWVLRG